VALGFVAGKSDIKKCFEMLDEDNSGQIEYKELAKMLRRLGST
jgi:Ca2+-binding EF-hand superfamily protein